MPSVHVFVPCYKRPDYTDQCLHALTENTRYPVTDFTFVDDGSGDTTAALLTDWAQFHFADANFIFEQENMGLRYQILQFWQHMLDSDADFVAKVDNDCLVPYGWVTNMLSIFADHPELDILSPDNHPGHPALRIGEDVGKRYRLATSPIGGLWFMRRSVLEGLPIAEWAKDCNRHGIKGAWNLMVSARKRKFVMGLTTEVCFQNVGHQSGSHPKHIKSLAHKEYSTEVGRGVGWKPGETA